MKILGFETSCDETAASVVENGTTVHSSIIATSKETFSASGGVIPEQAARMQVESIVPVLHQALDNSGLTCSDVDAIATTKGPGLMGSLLVGATAARVVSSLWKKPLIGVHHTLGHLSSTWLGQAERCAFPCITLSVSGGHSDIWYRTSHTKGICIGKTQDDAAGEAFDKGASLLGLSYPGGPAIAAAAEGGDPHAYPFPSPLKGDSTLNFSFSGLKTALKYTLRDMKSDPRIADITASYQHALCMHLTDQLVQAISQYPEVKQVHIVGGVSANLYLRSLVAERCSIPVITPLLIAYCTDNAAMIASAAFFIHQESGVKAYEAFETSASNVLL